MRRYAELLNPMENLENDEKSPPDFRLETPDQVSRFLDYLRTDYANDFDRAAIDPDSDWFGDIVRYAESGAFWKARILSDGQIIWTKKT